MPKYLAHCLCTILLVIYLACTTQLVAGSIDPFTHNATRAISATRDDLIRLEPADWWYNLIYDDGYLRRMLDERYPYLKQQNGSYKPIRDHFNFEQVFWPSEEYLANVNFEQHIYGEHRAFDLMTVQTSMDIWRYSSDEERAKSGGPKKDAVKCKRDMSRLFQEIKLAEQDPNRFFAPGATNIELLRWIDSWGRPVSETYYGNSYWVGSYRGCKYAQVNLDRTNNTTPPSSPMQFNYCWAKLAPRDYPQGDEMKPRMSMRAGICIPESCDTIEANKMKEMILRMLKYNFSPMHKQRFNRILDVYCLPQKPSPFVSINNMPQEMRWFLLISGAWLSLILAASLHYHLFKISNKQPESSSSWLKALTIQENVRVFVADDKPRDNSRVDLRALGLIKMFSCFMVTFAHCFLQSYWNFHSSTILLYECRRIHYHSMQFTWKTLEIFLVVTGILTSYFVVNKFPGDRIKQLIKPRNFLLLQLIRYFRLAPVMAFACAFMKAIFIHLSDGPFWDYGTWKVSPQGACQDVSWWRVLIWPILLDPQSSGGSHYQHECLPSSWYVVTELKMYLIIPLYIYMLVKWKRGRVPLLVATVAASTLFKYLQLQAQQLAHYDQFYRYGMIYFANLFIVSLDSAYFTVIDRFHAMAIGLFAGLYLYRYKTGKIKQWPFWMRKVFPLLFVGWQFYDLILRTQLDELSFRQTGRTPSDTWLKSWIVLKPRLDAIMVAIFALRLATDWSQRAMRYSLTIYKLSKLTYCVYMVHTLVIMFITTAHEKTRPDTVPLQLALMSAFVMVVSFLIALPFYLLVESPFALLIDHLLAQHKASAATKTSSPSAELSNKTFLSDKTNGENGAPANSGNSRQKRVTSTSSSANKQK